MNRNIGLLVAVTVAALTLLTFFPGCRSGGENGEDGNVYYVSPSGDDSAPGTQEKPWKTIQKAADTLEAGDTAYIMTGTYAERVTPRRSGREGKEITFAALPGHTPVIDGRTVPLNNDQAALCEIANRNFIRISGLQIVNANAFSGACGIILSQVDHVIIEKCAFRSIASSGIAIWDSRSVTIADNEIESAARQGEQACIVLTGTTGFEISGNHIFSGSAGEVRGEGITVAEGAADGKIVRNRIHHLGRPGIYIDAWDRKTSGIEVTGNTIHHCQGDGLVLVQELGGALESIRISNNLIHDNRDCGLVCGRSSVGSPQPMKEISIINNTFSRNGTDAWGGGLLIDTPRIEAILVRNNLFSQNAQFQLRLETDVPWAAVPADHNLFDALIDVDEEYIGTDFIMGPALFIDAEGGDFHLQARSPAIDCGSTAAAPADDLDGTARPQGPGIDIGCYERK